MKEYIPEEQEFVEKIVQVNRVSKKTKGGNKIGFSVLVVTGDKKGQVGVGLGKAPTVQAAIKKGLEYAKKHFVNVPMVDSTIPHQIFVKKGAAKVILKPASAGTGVIAGGAVRAVVEAAGIKDILSKVLGTSNQASNVYATMEALSRLKNRIPTTTKSADEKSESTEGMTKKSVKSASALPAGKVARKTSKAGKKIRTTEAKIAQAK